MHMPELKQHSTMCPAPCSWLMECSSASSTHTWMAPNTRQASAGMALASAYLVRLCNAHLHRAASMLDGGHRGCTCATIVPADLNDISIGLGYAASNSANAGLGHQLDRHLCLGSHLIMQVNGVSTRRGAAAESIWQAYSICNPAITCSNPSQPSPLLKKCC